MRSFLSQLRFQFVLRLFVLASVLLGSGAALAQVPDAGSLRQQIEREIRTPLPSRAAPVRPAEPDTLKLPDGVRLTVKAFRFVGNTRLSSDQLADAVRGWTGREIGFEGLRQATQMVANVYRKNDWIVRTFLPRQDVTDGVVTIQVVEARFAGARIEDPQPKRIRPAQVQAIFDAQQRRGAPLGSKALDRALLLADDLPGITVSGALEPGENDGETGVALTVRDQPLAVGQLALDNGGSRSTGRIRATASVSVDSPLRIGDQLRVDAFKAEGSGYYRLGYSLPVGAEGWRVGANASYFDYRLVSREFDALNARGNSTAMGLDASFPVLRSRLRNVYFNAAADFRRFENKAVGVVQSDYGVNSVSMGLAGNAYDNFGGGGASSGSLTVVHGHLRQGRPDPGENAAVAGGFKKIRYGASRQQAVTRNVTVSASANGQHSRARLDSSERFYLGGPGGVRAYNVNDGGGVRGQVANVEVQWRLPKAVVATAFYDWGRVSETTAGASQTLKGFGTSVGWTGPAGVNVKATWAARDGRGAPPHQPGPPKSRIWLQATVPFSY